MHIESIARECWRPPDRLSITEWAEKNVVVDPSSQYPGRFRLSNSPWLEDILDAYKDPSINTLSVMACRRGGKSLASTIGALWTIAEDPAPFMYVWDREENARYYSKHTLFPMLRACPPVAVILPEEKTETKTLQISFPSMPLLLVGSHSTGALVGKNLRKITFDEVDEYPEGAVEAALKCTAAFWNRKIFYISTPTIMNSVVHKQWLLGDRREWFFHCMKCGEEQQLVWFKRKDGKKWGLVFEEIKFEDGSWDYDRLADSVRYVCEHCGHEHYDVPSVRKHITSGHWKPTNLQAPKDRRSWHLNALLPQWLQWGQMAVEFVQANEALKHGDVAPLQKWINYSLAEPFEELDDETPQFGELHQSDYNPEDKWEREYTRFIGVDAQHGAKGEAPHYYWVCRAFSREGDSRLIGCGKTYSIDEVKEMQVKYGVGEKRVLIDSGWDAAQVYDVCKKYNWLACKSEDVYHFTKYDKGKSIQKVWKVANTDPFHGTRQQGKVRLNLILWSKPGLHSRLHYLLQGRGAGWEIDKSTPKDYRHQVRNYRTRERTNAQGRKWMEWKYGKEDHYLSCEHHCLLGAIIDPEIALGKDVLEKPEKKPETPKPV